MSFSTDVRKLANKERERYIDLALMLRRKSTGETLLCAGGVWDQLDQRYKTNPLTGARVDPSSARIFDMTEAQTPITRWYAGELLAFREGHKRQQRMALAIGDRRSSKTVGTCALSLATAVEVPRIGWHGLIVWIVGVSRPEMQELDRYLQWIIPAAWYERGIQEHLYRMVSGPEIYTISADNPKTLKRGEANVVLLNEGQKMPVVVLSNSIMGTVDNDGVLFIAANPPQEKRGEWVWRLKKGVAQGQVPATAVFELWSKDNQCIDQAARSDARTIVQFVDPDTDRIDGGGEFLLQEGKALPWFDPLIHVRPMPQVGLYDITALWIRKTIGTPFRTGIGLDFQSHPYMPACNYRIFGSPKLRAYLEDKLDASQLGEDDKPHYWLFQEIIAPTNSTEEDLMDMMYLAGMRRERSYCIGDASGSWQNATHQVGDDSFAKFRARMWTIVPPFEAKLENGTKPQNPRLKYRISLARNLCGMPPEEAEKRGIKVTVPRWFITPECIAGIKHLSECDLKPSHYNGELKPVGISAHYFDAATYPLCHWEPRPEQERRVELPDLLEKTLEELRRAKRQ